MKTYFFVLTFSLSILSSHLSFAQSDSLGMLGDQLDLYGVLDLFKNSDNLEEFEKKLNSEDNEVNNLDLNNDDKIDYIRVVDYKEGNSHAIVLQVPINDNESKDVAVIEVDQTADNVVHVQVVGDEDLYGKNYIVEPLDDNRSNTTVTNNTTVVVVNTWGWRPIRYFYGPSYRVWVSPWRWSYYPVWWRPWRPVGWYIYHPRVVRYRPYGRVVVVRRSPRIYTTVYAPRRITSKVVVTNRVRPAYYNRNTGPKTNTGSSTGRQSNNQGRSNRVNNGNTNNINQQPKRQEKNNQNINKEKRRARRDQSSEANPSNGGGQQHIREGGGGRGNHQPRRSGGGGGGRGGRRGR